METFFVFTVPNKKRKYYFLFALLLLLVNYILFFLAAYNRVQNNAGTWSRTIMAPAAAVLIGLLFGSRRFQRKDGLFFMYMIGAVLWMGPGAWLTVAVVILLGVLYHLVDHDFVFRFTPEAITLNTLPPRKYLWPNLQNVILKNGILTIDQKNNRLLQMDVSEIALPFSEEELNGFCKERVG
jgi:hypothetical protein